MITHLPTIIFRQVVEPSCHISRVLSQVQLRSVGLVLVVFVSRLGFLPGNISPLGSYGFFSNWGLYFLSIVVFDRFVGGSYSGFWWTYLGFAVYPFFGWLYSKLEQPANQSFRASQNIRSSRSIPALRWLLIPAASFVFFLLSNFGVWLHWYPHTPVGLLTCYTLALPFYTRTLLGDLIFGWGVLIIRSLHHNQSLLATTSLLHRPLVFSR